jgi:cell division protein FtsA
MPQEFIIDTQEGIKEPIGMSGIRLEAKVHIVTSSVSASQNIIKCIRRCGLEVDDIVLEQLASCHSVLTEDEKELGVCLIDIGGGTTDIAVYVEGAIKHTAVIPIAGDQVTNDIAVALRTPTINAEEIKQRYACAMTKLLEDSDEEIEVPSISDNKPFRKISRQTLADIIEPRYEELMLLVQSELRRVGYEEQIAAGIVLTGGSSQVWGLAELAEEIFHMPVRMGSPQNVTGIAEVVKNPIHSTGVGLLMYGRDHHQQQGLHHIADHTNSGSALSKIKNWFQGNF